MLYVIYIIPFTFQFLNFIFKIHQKSYFVYVLTGVTCMVYIYMLFYYDFLLFSVISYFIQVFQIYYFPLCYTYLTEYLHILVHIFSSTL